jgi:hypothetical protein
MDGGAWLLAGTMRITRERRTETESAPPFSSKALVSHRKWGKPMKGRPRESKE